MREFTKSFVSSSWALSLFGAQRVTDVLTGTSSRDSLAQSMDALTTEAVSRLSGRVRQLYDYGQRLQQESIDLVESVATGNTAGALTAGSQIVGPVIQSAKPLFAPVDPVLGAIDCLIPGSDLEVRWQEFNNQLEIFLLVPSVPTKLGLKPGDDTPLSVLVERAYGLGPFLSVWSVEGLGHSYGEMAFATTDQPRDLLTDPTSLNIPRSSLTMLNAGIGLAFAERTLMHVRKSSPAAEVRAAVQRILTLDQQNATPGYLGAAYESLGLVTHSFDPRLVQTVNDQLEQIAPDVLGYYWHGVGRSNYFSPRNLVPCSEINWSTVAHAAPNETARRNFIAGLSWAVTLVNMLQPQIMASVLKSQGDVVSQDDAFANGVASSTIMRHDTTPNAEFVQAFDDYEVPPSEPQLSELWNSQIRQPSTNAIDRVYPVLKQRNQLGDVFQYHPLWFLPDSPGS